MEFEVWHIWTIIGIIFFILEIFIPSFVVFNFGIGGLFAALAAAIGLNIEWQVLTFSVFTLTSFFLVRPSLKKWAYKRSHDVKTNNEAFINKVGVVVETIDQLKNSGRIKIDGDVWMARSIDGKAIETDVIVRVVHIDSIVLEVEPIISE